MNRLSTADRTIPCLHFWKKITNRKGIGRGWTHQCAKCGSVTDRKGVAAFTDGCAAVTNTPRK